MATNHGFSVRQNSANHGISTRLIAFLRYLTSHRLWNSALEQPPPHYQRRASDREPMAHRSDDQQSERRIDRRTERRGERRTDERRTERRSERKTERVDSAEVKSTTAEDSLLAIRYSIPIEYRVACYFSFPLVLGLAMVTYVAAQQDFSASDLYAVFFGLSISLSTVIFFMSRHITEPLKAITNAAANMNKGDLSQIPERRNDELGQLIQSLNHMSKGLARKSELEKVLGKFLDPDIANKIIDELDDINFKGENIQATALFADIVGYTQMSEKLTPAQVSELLNEYFGYYAACAKQYFGTVDKFLGDCVMLVFGAAKSDLQHQYHAVACALLMQKLTEELNEERLKKGLFAVQLRIGINSGEMLAGLLGSKDRLEYTVIGDSVNLASRLCNEAKANQIIIQEECHQALIKQNSLNVDNHKTIKIRGKELPVSIYNVTSLGDKEDQCQQDFIRQLKSQTSD